MLRRWGTLWKREKDKNVRARKSDGLFGEGKLERQKRQEKEEGEERAKIAKSFALALEAAGTTG